jgi:hypothetical protein
MAKIKTKSTESRALATRRNTLLSGALNGEHSKSKI